MKHRTHTQGLCLHAQLAPSSSYSRGCRCARCWTWHREYEGNRRRHRGTRFRDDFEPRLRYAMKQRGMSIEQVAARLGVGVAAVTDWACSIRKPQRNNLNALCRALNVKRKFFIQSQEPTT